MTDTYPVLRSLPGCACDGRDARCPCIRTVHVGIEELVDATDLARLTAPDRARALAALRARGEAVDPTTGEIVDARPECTACGGAGVVGGVCIGGAGDVWVGEEACEECHDEDGDEGRVAA